MNDQLSSLTSLMTHPGFPAFVDHLKSCGEVCKAIAVDNTKCTPENLAFLQGQFHAYQGIINLFSQELPLLVQQREQDPEPLLKQR